MPASNCGVIVGSLALSLTHVASVRQRVQGGSAANVVEAIGSLLQQRSLGTEEMLTRISQFADEAVTPGAAGTYAASLNTVVEKIDSLGAQIKSGQTATQTKLDTLFKSLQDAETAANSAKATADADDKALFECVADEQAKAQAAEAAEKSLSSSRSNEGEACQLQQDNKGFAFNATGKYKMSFECDFSVGNCDAQLQAFQETVLKKIEQDATAALTKDQANYNSLKAACDAKTQERVAAQSALGSAEDAWRSKRALCQKLGAKGRGSICAYGSSAQAKCAAEKEYAELVAATQQAKGGVDSEADRAAEWLASQTTKCMISKSISNGLDAAVAAADVDACASQVKFDSDVGNLNTRQGELQKLATSNKCAAGAITFFNGQRWSAPKGDSPQSESYTRNPFTPELNPAAANFGFCQAA